MAQIEGRATIETTITIALSEQEAGALDAIAGYGADEFLKVFYDNLGKAYLSPYEAGLRSLFESVRHGKANVRTFLSRTENAKKIMAGAQVISPE